MVKDHFPATNTSSSLWLHMLIGNDMRLKSLIESNWAMTDCHYGKEEILRVVLDTVLVDGCERVIFILGPCELAVV